MPPLQNEHARTMHHDGQRSHLGTLVDRLAGDGNGEQIGKRRRLGYRDHPTARTPILTVVTTEVGAADCSVACAD